MQLFKIDKSVDGYGRMAYGFSRGEMRTVMAVTGSRALAESPEADLWARDILRERITKLPDDAILVTGDAPGPDDWASALASARGLTVTVYDKHGFRTSWRAVDRKVEVIDRREWRTGVRPTTREEWKTWLLSRDKTMVEDLGASHRSGKISASIIALFAPWTRTQGTAYTLHHAKLAGLPWERLVCDASMTPRASP